MYIDTVDNSNNILKRASEIFNTIIEERSICELAERLRLKWLTCAAFCAVNKPELLRKIEAGIIYVRDNYEKSYDGCTFVPYISEVLLRYADDKLSDEVKEYLKKLSRDTIEYSLQNCWDFVDVNDNTPAMIMTFLFLAGERTEKQICIDVAEKRLSQYEERLGSRTFIAEFNSQTYHAINITAISALAQYTTNEDIRKRAIWCAEKLWKQAFLMYHKDSGVLCGPYSRSYTPNSLARTAQMKIMMYLILGNKITISPLDTAFSDKLSVGDMMENSALVAEGCLFAAVGKFCPEHIVKASLEENYPVSVFGDAQISASADKNLIDEPNIFKEAEVLKELAKQESTEEYPAGVSKVMAYKNKYYTLGTCTKEFHNGLQTDSFHSVICENSPIKAEEEITAIFSRYFINDEDISLDMGRKIAFQHENTALVCYTPKIYVGDIYSLKLSVLIGNTRDFEIYCNKEKLNNGNELNTDKPLVLKFKNVYAAVIPLKTEHIKIEKIDDCTAISFINYLGKPRRFAKKELKMISEGFAFEIRNSEECKSIDEFYDIISANECKDNLYANIHTRYAIERNVSYKNGSRELRCLYSPVSEGIENMRINEKNII